MSALLKTLTSRCAPVVRSVSASQRASMYTKAPKEKIGTLETVIAMGAFTLTILGPSGWILAHLEDYKKKE